MKKEELWQIQRRNGHRTMASRFRENNSMEEFLGFFAFIFVKKLRVNRKEMKILYIPRRNITLSYRSDRHNQKATVAGIKSKGKVVQPVTLYKVKSKVDVAWGKNISRYFQKNPWGIPGKIMATWY